MLAVDLQLLESVAVTVYVLLPKATKKGVLLVIPPDQANDVAVGEDPRNATLLPIQTDVLVANGTTFGKESILMKIEAVSLQPLLSVPVTMYF